MAKIVAVLCLFTSTVASVPDLYWRDYNGTIPRDALPTDHIGVYIAQVLVRSSAANIPGSLYSNIGTAITEAREGKIVITRNIKVLCTTEPEKFFWKHVNVHRLSVEDLERSVVGGFESNSLLYIGKIFHESYWKIAKVFPPASKWTGLRAWLNNGGRYITDDFEILMFR